MPRWSRQTSADRPWRPAPLLGLALAALAPSLLCGCGRSVRLGQVDGTVRAGGQPIGQVLVVFIPDDPHLPQSFGVTDDQGRFQLRCNNKDLGAAVGEHRVTLVDAAAAPASKSRDDDPPETTEAPTSRVPAIYNRANKTPLRQSVSPGTQTIALDIPSIKPST